MVQGGGRLNGTIPASFPTFESDVEELQVMSWNSRGSFLSVETRRKLKGSHSAKSACRAHVLCLQEVHGLWGDVVHSLGLLLPGFKAMYSLSVHRAGTFDPHSGGVAALLCPSSAAVANFEEQFVVPRKCLASSFKVRDKTSTVRNTTTMI